MTETHEIAVNVLEQPLVHHQVPFPVKLAEFGRAPPVIIEATVAKPQNLGK